MGVWRVYHWVGAGKQHILFEAMTTRNFAYTLHDEATTHDDKIFSFVCWDVPFCGLWRSGWDHRVPGQRFSRSALRWGDAHLCLVSAFRGSVSVEGWRGRIASQSRETACTE